MAKNKRSKKDKPARKKYAMKTPYKERKIRNIMKCNPVRVDPSQPRKDSKGKRVKVETRNLSHAQASNLWNDVRKRTPTK